MSGVRWALAGLGLLLACKSWFTRRREGSLAVQHALRLADEIASVAETIEGDLARLSGLATLTVLRSRCRECRERADAAFAGRRALARRPHEAVEELVEALHDDHRRVVNLRSEVDAALAGIRRGSRVYSYARSRYPSSSFPTKPSTL